VAGVAVGKTITFARDAKTAWVALRTAQLTTAAASTVTAGTQTTLAASTTLAGNAAGTAGGKFAAMRLGLVGLGAAAASAFVVFEVGREQIKGFKGDTEAAGDPVTWLAKQLGIWKGKANEATKATGEQSAVTGEAKKIQEEYSRALAAVGGKQVDTSAKTAELTGKLKELKQGFRDQVASVRDSVTSYDGLITKSDVTTKQVIGDLHNQVSNFKTYSKDVQRLIKAGVSPAAIQELSQKGPQYVHALATGSNRELKTYKGYWRDRQNEIKGSFADSMQQQYEALVRKMRAMQREINKLKGKTVDVKATAQVEIKESTRRGLLALGIKGYGTKFFARGGKITEGTTPTADDVLIRASKHETVVSAEDSRDPWFKGWAQAKRIPGYAAGGIVGGFGDPATRATRRYGELAAAELGRVAGKELGKAVANATMLTGGSGAGFGSGSWMRAINELVREHVPYSIVSTFRPGARTHASGSVSFHALNRAVDLDGGHDKMRIWRALTDTGPTELIYSRAPTYKSRSGWHPIGRLDPITRADHYSHVHAAYDQGGWLPPGLSMAVNRTGKPERVMGPGEPIELAPTSRRALARDIADELVAAGMRPIPLDSRRANQILAGAGLSNDRRR
jgi:hypothetical protein